MEWKDSSGSKQVNYFENKVEGGVESGALVSHIGEQLRGSQSRMRFLSALFHLEPLPSMTTTTTTATKTWQQNEASIAILAHGDPSLSFASCSKQSN